MSEITSIVSRLQKVNEGLMTISSLHRLKNMSGKNSKPCNCTHHRSSSRSRCPRKCVVHKSRDKNLHCSCNQQRPKLCLCCNGTLDDQNIPESSKISNADEELKTHSDHSTQSEMQREIIAKKSDKKIDVDDRSGPQFPVDNSSQRSLTKSPIHFISGNGDGKSEKLPETRITEIVAQSFDIVDKSEVADTEIKFSDDKKDIEKIYKELIAEKKRNEELEEKLKNTICSFQCLKNEGEEQAACLKDALEKAKNQAKLASRSRNLALDLAKQSRDQTDLVKASRDEIFNQINVLKSNNNKLECECEELRCKLREISANEEKKCAEVDDKVNKIKSAVKKKEMALASEKSELEETVAELTKFAKIQKKRICELTSICTKQRSALHEHEKCVSAKLAQLSEAENKIQSMNCRCGSMDDEIEDLKFRLNEEIEARKKLQKALDERQDNCNCELQIKDKIIGDQVETIKKLKKLVQDSEKMAYQAAREFESLRDELHCLKQSNKSLRIALDEAEVQMSDECEFQCCQRCNILESQLRSMGQQKHKALIAAKCAAEKLSESTMDYQRQLDCEKQEKEYVAGLLQRKDTEIELLKNEILHVRKFRSRRSNDYVAQ